MNDLAANHPSIAEQRVSVLVGDRLCTGCGYNLTGQPVLREPHYQMLIVRCPECATVASVQEYPLLGRWANRWAAVLAGFWMLIVVALWGGSAAAIFGMSVASAEIACEHYRAALSDRFQVWFANQTQAQSTTAPAQGFRYLAGVNDFDAWYKQQDAAALFVHAGGWRGAVNWWFLFLWFWLAVAAMALGCFWSVALLGRGRRGLLLAGALVMIVAAAFAIFPLNDWYTSTRMRWYGRVAEQKIGGPVLIASLLFAWIALCAGLMWGRSIARGMVRLLLPPRLRAPLALLWISDGLAPPEGQKAR
jgi:hypothetical protein